MPESKHSSQQQPWSFGDVQHNLMGSNPFKVEINIYAYWLTIGYQLVRRMLAAFYPLVHTRIFYPLVQTRIIYRKILIQSNHSLITIEITLLKTWHLGLWWCNKWCLCWIYRLFQVQQPSVKEGLDLMPSPSFRLYNELCAHLEHFHTH